VVTAGPAVEHRACRSIDEILADARRQLRRLDPAQAQAAVAAGALLVERNVLEWRFDPHSDTRLPEASGYDLQVIVMCSQGYTSSLAAAALQDLGLYRATDLAGGFQAWEQAGLPTQPG
jgi:rhodanese-related sulfurtransferase